jgi:YidC/Oxa1 family membrane protein insertase
VTHLLVTATIFQPLVDVFDAVLKAIHSVIGGSWGWSIVLLTVIVRALLLPLTVKQFHSMQKLQRLTPELKRIQAKYKEDKQRQQQELMKLYQEHGVNPFGSCLPLVAQLPVFIGLYYTLRTSLRPDICPGIQAAYRAHYAAVHNISLHAASGQTTPCGPHGGASFLFIPDLTNRATGAVLAVLLVLYVGTQLASSLMMSTPQMDRNQRLLMLGLPLVFVFIIIGFPAGVLVYWITTNLWTMGQQYFIKRRLGPATPLTAAADGDAAAAKVPAPAEPAPAPNGASRGVGGLLRGLTKGEGQAKGDGQAKAAAQGKGAQGEKVAAASRSRPRTTAPPPPPRKKKKRSGRRR